MSSLDFNTEKEAFHSFYDANHANLRNAMDSFSTLLKSMLQSVPDVSLSNVAGRVKERDECVKKFSRKYRPALETTQTPYTIKETITDLIGLRVVCLYEDEVDNIKNAISREFDVIDITDKIAQVEGTEASFGYKGLHLDLKLNAARQDMAEYRAYAEFPFELQIRTVVQDSWSIIDHKIKYKKSIPNDLKRRINTLAALFELADHEFLAIRNATSDRLAVDEGDYKEIEEETAVSAQVDYAGDRKSLAVPSRKYSQLDAFSFLRIANHFFSDFEFEPHKVDGFTQEIVSMMPGISRGKFNFFMRSTISDVKVYQTEVETRGEEMNPYTLMRHCLYKSDSDTFEKILTDEARSTFQEWIEQLTSHETTASAVIPKDSA
jgi:ppGpp synthetase/RelA/SpoT-type nucleotidyltranferase